MKRDKTRQRLDQLRTARSNATAEESIRIIRDALAQESSNYVTAKAAEIVEQELLHALVPDLLAAFDRLLVDPRIRDRGCEGLTAIAKALYALDFYVAGPYLRAIRLRQIEGFGSGTDVATGLRGICALALAQTRDERTMEELVFMLTDEYPQARMCAARALGCTGDSGATAVLMLKVLQGDPEIDVSTECLAAMLALAPDGGGRSLAFVIEQLDSPDPDRAEAAAIALGTIRDEKAFAALRDKWDSTAFGPIRERILHAMSASRTDPAIAFLLKILSEDTPQTAVLAIQALAIHRRDENIRRQVMDAAAKRSVPTIIQAVSASFGMSGTV